MCGHTWYIGTFFSNFTVNPKLKKKQHPTDLHMVPLWPVLFLISER